MYLAEKNDDDNANLTIFIYFFIYFLFIWITLAFYLIHLSIDSSQKVEERQRSLCAATNFMLASSDVLYPRDSDPC